jgi:hypothetical protein
MTRKKTVSVPAFLECNKEDGSGTVFLSLEKVLKSPELQALCIEKGKLRSAMRRLDQAGLLEATKVPLH